MKNILTLILLMAAGISFSATQRYRLMFNEDPATTITLGWEQISGNNAEVYFGVTDFGNSWASYPNSLPIYKTTNYMGMTNNFVKITGLSPNTVYYFVIKDSEGTSMTNSYWLKTCPDVNTEKLSFVSGGDSRSGQTQRQNSNRMVAKIRPHAVLFGGDLVNTPSNSSVQTWLDDWQLSITSDRQMIPLVHSFGNHEAYGTGGPEFIEQLFDTPYDVYYNIKFGGDLFSMYTLNGELLPGHTISSSFKRTQQTNWLTAELNSDASIWKGAQYHRPIVPHYSGKGEGADEFNDWANLFYDEGVRLVMESDAHVTKITEEVKPAMTNASGNSSAWFTSSGLDPDKGITFTGEGAWGTIRTPDDLHPLTIAATSMYHFTWITVTNCKIEVRTVDTQSPSTVPEHTATDLFSISTGLEAQIWKPTALPSGLIEITKCNPPNSNFTADQTAFFTGTTVNFTDLSTNTPTSWAWNFGDLGTSTSQNPSHLYSVAGTYNVELQTTNNDGTGTEIKIAYIVVSDPVAPVADFTADNLTASISQVVNFSDLSTNNPDTWVWDFGDLGTSAAQNPAHTYTAAGFYTVILNTSNGYGGDTETKTAYIEVQNGGTVSVSITNSNDDAEEYRAGGNIGDMLLTSSDLEIGNDGGTEQWMGMRFQNVNVPQGAIISNAKIRFRADESDGLGSQLNIYIQGEDEDNTASYSASPYDLSGRNYTTAIYTWADGTVPGWTTGTIYDSPNISTVVQEIVDRPGWLIGNAMSYIMYSDIGESSERVADSYEGNYPAELIFDWTIPATPSPIASFTQSTTAICEGGSIDFTDGSSNSPTSWTWDFGDGGSSTSQNPNYTYNTSGTYTVSLSSANSGGSDMHTMTNLITVETIPTVTVSSNQSICNGASVTISTSGATTYSWDNGLGAGSSHSISPNSLTTYTVIGSSSGCTSQEAVTITVNPLPTVSAGTNSFICNGASTSFTASGASTYNWDQGLGAGATQNVSPTSTLTYTVTGTDGNGCENVDDVIISVNALPIVGAGTDQTVCEGASVTLNGSGASSYTWSNGIIDGVAFNASSTATFLVTGTDGNGCENTDDIIISVNALPTVQAGSNQTVCEGTSITLSGSGASSYTWDNAVTDGLAFNAISTSNYTLTGTDGNGCINTDNIIITVDTPNNPGTSYPITACFSNSSIDLSDAVSGEDAGGSWNDDDATGSLNANVLDANGLTIGNTYNFSYTVPANGTCPSSHVTTQVTITGTVDAGVPSASNAICENDNSFDLFNSISGFTAGGFWSDDDATGALSGSAVDGTSIAAGTYNFTYTINGGACGNDSETIPITVQTLPTLTMSANETICEGDSVNISSSGATSYNWDNGIGIGASHTVSPTLNTVYTVIGSSGACAIQGSVTVHVNPLPIVVMDTFEEDTICLGETMPIALPAGAPTGGIYSGNGLTGNIFDPVSAGSGAHLITYEYTDLDGCVNSASQTILVTDCLGIKDADITIFKIYPNPAADYIIIERDNPSEFKRISIIDMNGKIIYDLEVLDNPLKISVEKWERGSYLIQFSNEKSEKISRRIILQ